MHLQYACFANSVPVFARGVYLRFDDLHDAAEAKDILEQHDFLVNYVSGYDFAIAKTQETAQLNEFEGQLKLTVLIEPHPGQSAWVLLMDDLDMITKSVELTAGVFGVVRNCVHVDSVDDKLLLDFRIEFHSIDAANRAVQSLRIDPVWSLGNDVSNLTSSFVFGILTPLQKSFKWYTASASHWTGERALASPQRIKPRIDDQGRIVGYRPAADQFPGVNAYRHPHDQHNRVRRERILDGGDVRTTIMLRNIPNKLDWVCHHTLLIQR